MNMGKRKTEGDRRWSPEKNKAVKKLFYGDLMDRKSKALCFRFGEKFHHLHQFPEQQFRLMVLADDEVGNSEGEIIALLEVDEGEELNIEYRAMGLFGVTNEVVSEIKTMKLAGKLRECHC